MQTVEKALAYRSKHQSQSGTGLTGSRTKVEDVSTENLKYMFNATTRGFNGKD